MSMASKTGTILFVKNSGTYTAMLQCDKGDLYQMYDGTEAAPSGIIPDFSANPPTIAAVYTNSLSTQGTVRPNSVVWNFNGTPLAFDDNGVSTNQFNGETGHFKRIDPAVNSNDYFKLQIVKNLVKAAGGASSTIQALATVATGATSISLNAVLPVSISKKTGASNRVLIVAGDDKFFTITESPNGSCILKAIAQSNGVEIAASGLTYQWRELNNGVWTDITGATKQTLTVTNDMVATNGQFQVEVYQGGQSLGMDVQSVSDLSDPYDIIPNPSSDEIVEGSNKDVTFSPILVKRGSSEKVKDMTWYFSFFGSAGDLLNSGTSTTASATGTLTYAMAEQAGGPVNWYIESKE